MAAEIPPPRSSRPATIGRYRILDRIGKGAMGVVYSARDETIDRLVALKVLVADFEADPQIHERFYREARLAAQLQHRNIVTVLDLGEEDGRLFIVMELLRGATLGEFLRQTPSASLEQKLDLMVQVCEGLGLAHSRGVYHRDVKPGNLFVQTDGSLKILDFGIARMASSSLTTTGLLLGTPDFMAPEQARGEAVDQRSDVFSAAAVFYLMLSGRKPFDAADLPGVLHNVERKDPMALREDQAPAELSRIVFRALAKNPAERYQRMADMLVDLIKFRRRFDGETRRRTLTTIAALTELARTTAEQRTLLERLQLPEPAAADPLAPWRDQYPQLAERGHEALASVPMRRHQADAIAAAAGQARHAAERVLSQMQTAARELEHGRSIEADDPAAALERYERALGACPESPVLADAVHDCRLRVAERQTLEERLQACRLEAQRAIDRREWAAAIASADVGLQLAAADAALLEIRTSAEASRDRELRERQAELATLAGRTAKAVDDNRFADARELIRQLERLDPDYAYLNALRDRLQDAEQRVETARALEAEAAAALARARELFAAGSHDAAIEHLRTFVTAHPHSADAARALEAMTAEAMRIAEQSRRRAEAARLAAQAEEAWQRGDADAALRMAEAALNLHREEPRAVGIAAEVRAHLRAVAERDERTRRARAHLDQARELLAQGRWNAAVQAAQEALRLDAGIDGAPAVIAEARQAEEDAAARRAEEQAALKRARAAAPIMSTARAAFREGDWSRAHGAAELALAIDPENTDARELLRLLADTAATRARARAATGDPDDTVSLIAPSVGVRLKLGAQRLGAAMGDTIVTARRRTEGWVRRGRGRQPGPPRAGAD